MKDKKEHGLDKEYKNKKSVAQLLAGPKAAASMVKAGFNAAKERESKKAREYEAKKKKGK
jgi:hypothetical protein